MQAVEDECCATSCANSCKNLKFLTPYESPLIIESSEYHAVVNKLRSF